MPVYLPIAEMSVNAFGIIFLGIVVGFFSGLFGVGGGFLAMPLLMLVGIPPSVAVTTQNCQIVASSAAGVISQWKRRHIDVPMATHMLFGGFGGLVIGVAVFHALKLLGQIDFAIAALYTLLLAGIGTSMGYEVIAGLVARRRPHAPARPKRVQSWLQTLPRQTHYAASGITTSIYGPAGIGFIGGLMVSILGSGGSFMIVPAMIFFLGVPAMMVTGTSLFQLLILAMLSCVMHTLTTQSIDILLAALLICGSVIGTILGLRASKIVNGTIAHALLATLIIIVAIRMGYGLVVPPQDAFTVTVVK